MKRLIALSIISAALAGCGGKPLFTEMATNRLVVKLHGTYESGGTTPRGWIVPADVYELNDKPDISDVTTVNNSIDDCPAKADGTTLSDLPTRMMLDIAEIRLGDANNGWAKFANYRQTYTINIADTDPFFNGDGITLVNDDPPGDNFSYVWLYLRKVIFDGAKKYDSSCNELTADVPKTYFAEKIVNGFDFNQLQVNTYWDGLRIEGEATNRVFPVRIPISGGLKYDRTNKQTVLEIRMVVQNFIKKYEIESYASTGDTNHIHFFGFSDWLRDIQASDYNMGGNLLSVARAYVPGTTGSLSVTVVPAGYVILVPESTGANYFLIAGDRDRNHGCNFPVFPSLTSYTTDGLLDYYLKVELYKTKWNTEFGTCGTSTIYEGAWTTYNDKVSAFQIPGIAVYLASGTHTISNIQPGTYYAYFSAAPAYGALFGSAFAPSTTTPIIITAGNTHSNVGF